MSNNFYVILQKPACERRKLRETIYYTQYRRWFSVHIPYLLIRSFRWLSMANAIHLFKHLPENCVMFRQHFPNCLRSLCLTTSKEIDSYAYNPSYESSAKYSRQHRFELSKVLAFVENAVCSYSYKEWMSIIRFSERNFNPKYKHSLHNCPSKISMTRPFHSLVMAGSNEKCKIEIVSLLCTRGCARFVDKFVLLQKCRQLFSTSQKGNLIKSVHLNLHIFPLISASLDI